MSVTIKTTTPDEYRAAGNAFCDAMSIARVPEDEWDGRLISWDASDSLSAWDGARCVGHVSAFRFDTTVPGGARLQTSGVTRVGVLPTYTRQGLLTQMMARLLTEAREHGNVLATLRASEAVIYGRYGFGIATESVEVEVAERPRVTTPTTGSVRLLTEHEVREVVPDLYDRCARWRAGTMSRPPFQWNRFLKDASNGKPSFVAVHTDASGVDDGYVHYDTKWSETAGDHDPHGVVNDLFATNGEAEVALWKYLFGIDLVRDWRADQRPVDDAVRFALFDSRSYRVRGRWDDLWLRLLDVEAALTRRVYGSSPDSLVVAVADPLFADNTGAWRITKHGAERTSDDADVSVPIEVISALYLGGPSWRELASAGRVTVHRAGALATADALFAQCPAPFGGTYF